MRHIRIHPRKIEHFVGDSRFMGRHRQRRLLL
jgi:hypothetical protein